MKKLLAITFLVSSFNLTLPNANAEVISASKIKWGHLNPARGDKSPNAANLFWFR